MIAAIAVAVVLLSCAHGFVSMWVEGVPEFESVLRYLAGYGGGVDCGILVAGHVVPLALTAYVGGSYFYLYLPASYALFKGWTNDPYFYRYTGILLFALSCWLLYLALRQFVDSRAAAFAAVLYACTPIVFYGVLTESQGFFVNCSLLVAVAYFYGRWLKTNTGTALIIASFLLGATVNTRAETFVWPVLAYAAYSTLTRWRVPRAALARTRRWKLVAGGSVAACGLGALPMIVYQLHCANVIDLLRHRILPASTDASAMSLPAKAMLRVQQFGSYVLLNEWQRFELNARDWVFAAVVGALAAVQLWHWIVARRVSFPLTALLVTFPLTLLITGTVPRTEHLIVLTPLLPVIVAIGLSDLMPSRRHVATGLFILMFVSNVVVCARDWQNWVTQPASARTMLNQSDPALLTRYLQAAHPGARIIFTNIGIGQYARYVTAGRLRSEDAVGWSGPDEFSDQIGAVLADTSEDRVFVAISEDRDGYLPFLPRTSMLLKILRSENVPYDRVSLKTPRFGDIYEVIRVKRGDGVSLAGYHTGSILLTGIVDVRVQQRPDGIRAVVGSLQGSGFENGDRVLVDRHLQFGTAFGNGQWITFSIPTESVDHGSHSLAVIRNRTHETSATLTLLVP